MYDIEMVKNMKKRILVIALLFLIVINVIGCAGNKSTKYKPSEEELARAEIVCGVVRSVDKENIRIQLCGNIFDGVVGKCYVDVVNEYSLLEVGDSVLLYYTGKPEFEEKVTHIDARNMDVKYMEAYENDGRFTAHIKVSGNFVDENGEVYPSDDPRAGCALFIESLENEPEWNFRVNIYNKETEKIKISFEDESVSITENVTVTYDTETMEVISIIQD